MGIHTVRDSQATLDQNWMMLGQASWTVCSEGFISRSFCELHLYISHLPSAIS